MSDANSKQMCIGKSLYSASGSSVATDCDFDDGWYPLYGDSARCGIINSKG